MNKKVFVNVILFIFISLVFNKDALSWTEETHMNLSKYSAESSVISEDKDDYLKNLGFDKGLGEYFTWENATDNIRNWIANGANLEDKRTSVLPVYGAMRSVNHFHNPLKSAEDADPLKTWENAGLDDWVLFLHYTGRSSLLWAQDGSNQQNFPEEDWSWKKVREKYYYALISVTDEDRQMNFAQTFRGLGHQMHLIQDAAQPDHVRNDAHPEDSLGLTFAMGFEKWAGREFRTLDELKFFAPVPIFPEVPLNISYNGLVPITQFIDTDQYDGTNPSTSLATGIAEYTNANFFSDNTIFAAEKYSTDDRHYFPYPKKTSTNLQYYIDENLLPETIIAEDGVEDVTFYIKKESDGETIDYFVKPIYFAREDILNSGGDEGVYNRDFYRDEKCHQDYASLLIPRAVGYSAGLLDYFFRGKINIVQTGTDTFQIVNLSDEDMEGNLSSFKLYYDNINDERIEIPLAFYDESGTQYTDPDTVLSIPAQTKSLFKAELQSLPVNPKSPGEYMLVYKGRLGSEGAAPYDTDYAVTAQKITPHFLTHAEEDSQWDVYEYDLLGNRIYNLTGGLARGTPYYNGIPNPVNPDELFYLSYSGCTEGWSCLHLLTKSTEETENLSKYGLFWWSNNGTRIYAFHDGYYDISTSTWMTSPWIITDACLYSGFGYPPSFSNDETKIVVEALDPYGTEYDYDILIYTNTVLTHIVDMNNTGSLLSLNEPTDCAAYGGDENFMDAAPDYHPTEERILFTSNADGAYDTGYSEIVPYEIYIAEVNTGNIQKLTNTPGGDRGYYQPEWSPDGEQILMAGQKQGESSEIYLMPADGGTLEKITDEGVKHYFPRWITYLGQ